MMELLRELDRRFQKLEPPPYDPGGTLCTIGFAVLSAITAGVWMYTYL
jgi:hypothetical protein